MNKQTEIFNELVFRLKKENLIDFKTGNYGRGLEYHIDFRGTPKIEITPNKNKQVFVKVDFGWQLGQYTESKRFGDKKKGGVDYDAIIHYIEDTQNLIGLKIINDRKEIIIKEKALELIPDNIRTFQLNTLSYLSNGEYQYEIKDLQVSLNQLKEISKILEK